MMKVALCLALFVVVVNGQCPVPLVTEFSCLGSATVVTCNGAECAGTCVRVCDLSGGYMKCQETCSVGALVSCGGGTCPFGTTCQSTQVCPTPPSPSPVVPLASVVSQSLSDALGTVTYTDAVANGGNAYTGGYSTGDYGFSRSDSGAFDDGTAVAYTDVDATLGYEAEADAFATSNPGPPSPPPAAPVPAAGTVALPVPATATPAAVPVVATTTPVVTTTATPVVTTTATPVVTTTATPVVTTTATPVVTSTPVVTTTPVVAATPASPSPSPPVPLASVVSQSLSDALGTVTYTDAVANGGNAYTGGYSTGDYGFSRSDSGAFDDGTAVAYTDVDATLGYEAEADAFATSNPGPPSPPSP